MSQPHSAGEAGPTGTTRLGYLLGPHGVQGGIKLYLLGDAAQVRPLKRVYVAGKGWLRLTRTEPLAPGLVLHLAGVDSREAAEALRGLNVYAADDELPALPDGEFYYHDLRGLELRSAAGEVLGRVSDVLDMGHQDILVIETSAHHEAFVPLQAPYVQVIMPGRKPTHLVLTDDAPDGLLSSGDEAADSETDDSETDPGA